MEKQKKKQKGITLVALVISIIVMLILAGVSLNMTIGDNGIIKQAQSASYEMGMAALEEWLQQEYVTQYDNITDSDEGNKIAFLNRMFNYTLLLKDGSRDYIINEGKVYYLLNKSCKYIPKEVKDGLLGGDTTEYSKYTRLEDVYGITKDLKVFYCNNGIEGAFGTIENYDIDPNASATGINSNSNIKNAITDILASKYGIAVDSEKGVTLANASVLSNLELDGTKYSGITDISGLGDLKNLKTLTLSNLNLTSLNGLEGISGLYYLYLKNTTVGDYTALASCLNLKNLYLYLPSTISQEVANNQVLYLGQGLKDASGLTQLEYFGISGITLMFDDTITKNTGIPSEYNNGTNTLTYSSSSKSNVTNLGEDTGTTKTGLYAFNDVIKNKIKYMYLNNNNFSNVNALSGFTKIEELQLMCNPSLSNINALSNNTSLQRITLQNCALTALGTYDSTNKVYSGGLTGCKSITKLSIQNNSGLTSLVGIESATSMQYLVANNCNITNIDSLANHSAISYLKLSNNTSLVSVKYIQHCKSLRYIYLDSNTNMASTEVDSALNGSDTTTNSLGTDVLIKNCINSYNNIPKAYWDLFITTSTTLDWSYETLGEKLTVNSAKWVKLKGRSDVKKLKLDGQTELLMDDKTEGSTTYYGIKSTLKTLTGMVALSMKNMSQVNNIDFMRPIYETRGGKQVLVSGMPSLDELFISGVNSSLVDLSVLNDCTSLQALYIDNPSIKLELIQTAINRFNYSSNSLRWNYGQAWGCGRGLNLWGKNNVWDFSKCTSLTKYICCGGPLYNGTDDLYSSVDLSPCTNMTEIDINYAKVPSITAPASLTKFYNYPYNPTVDLSRITVKYDENGEIKPLRVHLQGIYTNALHTKFSTLNSTIPLLNNDGNSTAFASINGFGGNVNISKLYYQNMSSLSGIGNMTNLKWIGAYDTCSMTNFNSGSSTAINTIYLAKATSMTSLSGINNFIGLTTLTINKSKITNCSDLSTLTGLTSLTLNSNKSLNNISGISTLKNLTTLSLYDNAITNLTPLLGTITYSSESDTVGRISYTELNLKNNSLDGYSAADNITVLLKLHAAGLRYLYISGNNFSANEVNELKNGKTVTNADGTKTTYAGFGASYVTN